MNLNDSKPSSHGRKYLIPKFSPPPPSSFQNMSHYDRLDCLLSLQRSTEDQKTNETSRIQVAMIATSPSVAAVSARTKSAPSDRGGISLFGGAVMHVEGEKLPPSRRSFQQASVESTARPPSKKAKLDIRPLSTDPPPMHPFFASVRDEGATSTVPSGGPYRPGDGLQKDVAHADAGKAAAAEKKSAQALGPAVGQSKHKGVKPFTASERDLQGMGMVCHIAGAGTDGLRYLVDKCTDGRTTAALSLLCADEHMTSNLDNTTVKYCTPSVQCTGCSWACDRAPRANKAAGRMLGAVIVVRVGGSAEEESFFLPLLECGKGIHYANTTLYSCDASVLTIAGDSTSAAIAGTLPLLCGSSEQERWRALRDIIEGSALKIIYNFQVFMLPLLSHCIGDLSAIKPSNVVDPRVAKFMCGNEASLADIELQAILHPHTGKKTSGQLGSDVDESQIMGLGKIARKANVHISILKQHFPAIEFLRNSLMQTNSWSVFNDLEMRLVPVLALMEFNGMMVSNDALDHAAELLKSFMGFLENKVVSIVGSSYGYLNLQSPDQVARLLYEELHLPRPAATPKSRHASTSEKELTKLAHLHPVVNYILLHRGAAKVLGTYVDGIRQFISEDTSCSGGHRVHACLNQTVASTGRLSCSRPNLQSIPKEALELAQEGEIIDALAGRTHITPREFFVARPGCCLLSVDYSQIEMRIMAQISGDAVLGQLFNSSGDVYVQLASKIFNTECENVSSQQRTQAKVICLGVIYGMGAKMASERLGIEVAAVYKITTSFFTKFHGLKNWMSRVKKEALKTGYVATIFGRRRYLPEINSSDSSVKAKAERQAVNTIIQGSASDLLKHVMLRIGSLLDKRYGGGGTLTPELRPKIVMQVHDELIYEVPLYDSNLKQDDLFRDRNVSNFCGILGEYMTSTVRNELNFNIPLKVNMTVGLDWGHMIKLDVKERPSDQLGEASSEPSAFISCLRVIDKKEEPIAIRPGKRSVD